MQRLPISTRNAARPAEFVMKTKCAIWSLSVAWLLAWAGFLSQCAADPWNYGVDQKGYGAKQKGCPEPYSHPHRHLCEPPPELPLLQSVAVMRVAGPERRLRLRVEQESGVEPESAQEKSCDEELAAMKRRLDSLEKRFDLLFNAVQKLVDRLQP